MKKIDIYNHVMPMRYLGRIANDMATIQRRSEACCGGRLLRQRPRTAPERE